MFNRESIKLKDKLTSKRIKRKKLKSAFDGETATDKVI